MTTKTPERELHFLETSNVRVLEGHNPRGKVDTKSDTFAELVDSIGDKGVLLPILVGPPGEDGKYPLIAGERRLLAALEAKLSTIPAQVAGDLNGNGFAAAVAENLIRENMTPTQEARALEQLRTVGKMSQKDAAEALGKSERWARDREKLLELPESVAAAFDNGAIAKQAIPDLVEVGKKAPAVAEALSKIATEFAEQNGPQFGGVGSIGEQIDALTDDQPKTKGGKSKLGCLIDVSGRLTYQACVEAGLPHATLKDAKSRFAKIEKRIESQALWYGGGAVEFSDSDIAAAKEAGCLLELASRTRWGDQRTQAWITSAEFLDQRMDGLLERAETLRQRELKQRESRSGGTTSAPAKKKSPGQLAEEKQAREQEKKRKAEALETNVELGLSVMKAYAKPKVTLDEAKAIAQLALEGNVHALAVPYAYTDPAFHGHDEKHDCTTFASGYEVAEKIEAALESAKTVDEVWGVVLKVTVAAAYSSSIVERLPSRRKDWDFPQIGAKGAKELPERLRASAKKRKALPTSIEKRVKREEAERRAAEALATNQWRGAALEILAASKKKLTEYDIANGIGYRRPAKDDVFTEVAQVSYQYRSDLIEGMSKAKAIDGFDDGEISITAKGKELLEQLRTEERERLAKLMEATADGDAGDDSGGKKTRTDKALALIKANPGITASEIAKEMKVKPNYLYRILGDLEKQKKIEQEGRKYIAVDGG